MGKLKKGFNWKARQNDVEYQNQTQAKVNIDIDIQEDKYDESNAFVLPSKKLKTEKVKSASIPQQKPLSKKKRRKLEQVMKKKIVGQTRKQLYDELQKFQATPKELRLMTSVSEAQTIGVKRLTSNQIKSNDMMGIRDTSNGPKRKINSIKGSNKLRAKRKKGKLPIPTKESSSSDGSGSDSLISGSLKNGNSIVQTEMHIQTEPAENGNTTIQNEAKDEMDVNVDVCGNKCNENSAIVSLSKKKKTKNMESNSVTPVKSSKKETKMEKQLKQKKFKRKQKKQLNGNLEEAESIEELAVMTSLSEDPTKDDESIESNAEPSDDSMKHVPVLKAEETEMDVGLDACEDKCDENSAVVPSSKKKKTKNVKSKSVIQMNLSKQEGKMKKQLKQKKSKREKKKQLDGNLEEAESINKESVEVTSVSEDQTKDDKRSTNASSQKTPISMLQEQCARLGMTPDYKLMSVEGVVHAPIFMYRVQVGDESATSTGQSKKKAKHAAAKAIIEVLTEKGVFNELWLQSDSLFIDTSVLDSSNIESETQSPKVPAVHVPVLRTEEIEKARSALPILSEEHTIMDAINKNPVVVIYGETGCGKTTQIPQFLYEAGYASEKSRIGITEPRRLAAITMSQRVAHEMSLPCSEVSYKIRYEGNVTKQTKIKFMTDGVLLKEIKNDFYLTKYQAIIIDEAHERTMQSDVLIGLLSRVVNLREKRGKPLKLIIMSATLRLEDFLKNKKLFDPPPPLVTIDARQHPVTALYNRHTVEDYIGEAYRKVCKIHRTNQYGGILVFVTGQEEVNSLCRKLKRAFPTVLPNGRRKNLKTGQKANESNQETEEERQLEITLKRFKRSRRKDRFEGLPNINLDDYCAEAEDEDEEKLSEGSDNSYICSKDDDEEMLATGNDDCYVDSDDEFPVNSAITSEPLHVLPLYSMLPADQQAKVFQPPPAGRRLCVIATNVAETSLTVPNVKYVVDTGKVKRRMYDKVTGVSTFIVTWISKASAKQRAGRAGRTCAGYCYRLYSSAVYENDFPDFFEPEITQRPVDDIVLQLKFMRIDRVVDFPFPRSPDVESIKAAEERLVLLGALEKHRSFSKKCEWASTITPFGQTMACISVSPRYSKMIALSNQRGVMPYTIVIVAALTVQEIFLDDHGTAYSDEQMEQLSKNQKHWKALRLNWAVEGQSRGLGDVMALLEAVGIAEDRDCTPDICHYLGVRYKAMMEIRKLRKQLTNEVNLLVPKLRLCVDPHMKAPTELQKKFLRQIMLSGMADHVARKLPECTIKDEDKRKLKNAYECLEIEEPVFIHPSSVLFKQLPEFVIYQEIIETTKHYMKIVSAVQHNWLPTIGPQYCTFSDPLDDPPPRYNSKKDEILCHMGSTYGWRKWIIEPIELKYPQNDQTSITWFAQFFLEGEICTSLKMYSTKLLSKPSVLTKNWARVMPRAKNLLNAFITYRIDSKKSLEELWGKDPTYLLKEYCEWLPESFLYEVSEKWPPS